MTNSTENFDLKTLLKTPLLGVNNAKTEKGESVGYMTFIMYLVPFSEFGSVCPKATEGCKEACLVTAGRNKFESTRRAKLKRTELFFKHRDTFFKVLVKEIQKAIKKAERQKLTPAIRLNGTSDISFENFKLEDGKNIFQMFPEVQFYDYTKNYLRFNKFKKELPKNYHLTFSMSENFPAEMLNDVSKKCNLAIVYGAKDKNTNLESYFEENTIINGDENDLRFLDPKNGRIIGLKAKGSAKHDKSGFVRFV